jgi:hypothetical protein
MPITACDWHGTAGVKLTTASLELVAIHGQGPRIASLRLRRGAELLFWADDPEQYARPLPGRGTWYLRGGHRVWVTRPGADEGEDTYAPDNEPATCRRTRDGFELTGAACPFTGTRRSLAVRIVDDDTLEVDNRVENLGPMLYSCGVWGLTCTLPSADCRYVIPMGDGSAWDCVTVVHFRKWGGTQGQDSFADDQFTFTDDALLLRPAGRENKRMVQSASGAIVRIDHEHDSTFGIRAPYDPQGRYPLGTNIATYVGRGNFMVEMETMGPAHDLKPGQTVSHLETWRLRRGAIAETGAAAGVFMA